MKAKGDNGRSRKLCFLAVFLMINLIAVYIISAKQSAQIDRCIYERMDNTGEMFQKVMDNYEHSFRLFVEMMQSEINHNEDPDHIWNFLKDIDADLLEIEGETFDGLYMYYKGRYLYSWDTPYSQYEETGYVATERPWYQDAVAGGGAVVFTPPYMSYANHYILTTLSQLQPDGETVFAYDIKMGDIQKLVSSQSQYEGEQIFISDAKGTVIGSTNEDYLGGCFLDTLEGIEQSMAAIKAELDTAENEEQIAKLEEQMQSESAFYDLRQTLGNQAEKLSDAKGNAEQIILNKTRYYGMRRQQGDYSFWVLVPAVTIWKVTLGTWLVPLLLVELLLVYLMSRISKGMKNRELRKAYVELGQTQKRLEIALAAAQKAAAIDALTGLMNFKSFCIGVEDALKAMEKGESGILIMIDGDHFKQVNDNYGHSVGDEVIKLTAQMIIGRIRVVDLASRLHGDEFAIFVANTSDYEVARRIMEDINETLANEAKKRNYPVITLSAGAVVARHGDTYPELAKAADAALYRAKETHDGRFMFGE